MTCDHANMEWDQPQHLAGCEWSCQGLVCPDCGYRNVTVIKYTPVQRPCIRCGNIFDAMPDEEDDICNDCFRTQLAKLAPGELAKLLQKSGES